MHPSTYTAADFGVNPLMFYYEITQACDLVCKHCRASAQENPAEDELLTPQSLVLLEQVATFPRKPVVVFTGGDPLKRADLFTLIEHAVSLGLQTALTPSATPLATKAALERAKKAGIGAFGISLDGPDAATHDAFRGFEGSFEKTLEMLESARSLGVPVQVNTSITKRNYRKIDAIAELLSTQGIMMWSLFFLVPVGRGVEEERITPTEYLQVFEQLWKHSQVQPYSIKTTEAPHYRRFVLEKGGDPLAAPQSSDAHRTMRHRAPLGITDGRGIMFTSHNGEIFPAGFLPIVCGRFPNDSVVEVYQKHPVFQSLQDPDQYKGICGKCNSRQICGGSRARAYAVTGDPLEAEPDCLFEEAQ